MVEIAIISAILLDERFRQQVREVNRHEQRS